MFEGQMQFINEVQRLDEAFQNPNKTVHQVISELKNEHHQGTNSPGIRRDSDDEHSGTEQTSAETGT